MKKGKKCFLRIACAENMKISERGGGGVKICTVHVGGFLLDNIFIFPSRSLSLVFCNVFISMQSLHFVHILRRLKVAIVGQHCSSAEIVFSSLTFRVGKEGNPKYFPLIQ